MTVALRPVKSAPPLWTINGCGVRLFGFFSPPGLHPLEIRALCVCLLFVPLLPLQLYLVEETGGRSFKFYGRLPFLSFCRLFGLRGILSLLVGAFMEGAILLVVLFVVVAVLGAIFHWW